MLQLHDAFRTYGMRTRWLTLDRTDNDPQRFLDFVRESLHQEGHHPGRGLDTYAASPIGDVATSIEPVALFVDDCEAVADQGASMLIRELIDQLPRGSRLVIGSRKQPDLRLARLRAQGLVCEFGAADLRFSADESRQLLSFGLSAALTDIDLELLNNRTEGWPTAVALASMALEHHRGNSDFLRHFSGSTQAVADYLSDMVLDHQPADAREFMLATSILRQLNVSVCQAILPKVDCASLLRRLESSNLFLLPIAGQPDQWRYHPLFADFLRVRLLRDNGSEYQRLHLAASGWYEAHGHLVQAIDHAIEGGDHPQACALLADRAMQFLSEGRLRLLARWFAAIPSKALRQYPLLEMISLWATTFTQGGFEAMRRFEASSHLKIDDPNVRAHVDALRCAWFMMQDRPADAYAAGQAALERLPTSQAYADNVLGIVMSGLMAQYGESDKAHHLLDVVRQRQGDALFIRMFTESVEGDQDLQNGLLRQATARFRIAIGASHSVSRDFTSSNAWAGILYAFALYEADQLDKAERLFRVYLPVVQPMGLQDHVILASLCLSRIARARGDIDEATAKLVELEQLGRAQCLPRIVASARLEYAHTLMLQGRAQESANELDEADRFDAWGDERRLRRLVHVSHDPVMERLRWALHFGDPQRALSELNAELVWSGINHRPLRTITLSMLRAAALHRTGEEAEALVQLREVLTKTAEEGFVRRVIDEGPLLLSLIPRLLVLLESHNGDPLLIEYLQRIVRSAGPFATPTSRTSTGRTEPTTNELLEPLTPKEIRALELLAEGYSNLAIAEKLGVSRNTIRTHLRNINAKFDVTSRTQAIARARQLGLLQ
ncbi:LuxR C-terminal-related transcriptional regulator [Burkholderia vietnamiensis]|uniref:LuxR C-terminal-related transcriptional regulator n=1 Tax=Burkholderia vietnamiensis TaxID=60552 RepID=A0AAW7SVQ4_BURVI|nr:LuxR C-terminal-related transcriptional regulator [Burkholderia vietnamiensis]MBH9645853.1 helix-turn-helix transcriptional regulator [Burkholderia vietnamiensis]MBR8008838.1 helix-turn-helix transcriptional regulator [Burkholderia vietnamiensis]MDN7551303.1 LuxR C-terminal-related transcriptional regulator [Burkholderia vietnamiensis]MDN7795117.1 LuxR C-terminal-related transcriptional regulator [Burkholderia vietnamiensis]MDN8044975.1 LuxR C-terminal-related transcriptional regulator [Bur